MINVPNSIYSLHPVFGQACVPGPSGPNCDPWKLVSILLPNLIVLAGTIFAILILYYGWRLLQVAGSEIGPQQIHKAQQAVSYSILGFLLVVSAYFIMQIVSYSLGIDFKFI
jgi:hypothetical protein